MSKTTNDKMSQALAQITFAKELEKEFFDRYPKNDNGEPEADGCKCVFSLCDIMGIIRKQTNYSYGNFADSRRKYDS